MSLEGTLGFSEAKIQVLIAMIELAHPKETPNNNFYTFHPTTLADAATYFRGCLEDWTDACGSLVAKRLLVRDGKDYVLSERGVLQASQVRDARPPIWYWYVEFYTATAHSQAYATFCERLYGRYLCQAGFSDMDQIHALIDATALDGTSRVLDLGCGSGWVAEYLSDVTGAHVSGIDYCPEAIWQAQARTHDKRHRLSFWVGDLEHLDCPDGAFDAITSIDTIFFPKDMDATISRCKSMLARDGQMAIFYTHFAGDAPTEREALRAEHSPLARALVSNGLAFRTWDFTEETYRLMQRKRELAEAMEPAFEAEGNLFLYDHLVTESESSTAPFDPDTSTSSRHLYHVKKPGS